jgi:plasmid stabilization system protein ParE
MIPVALRMEARADLVEAALWYEGRTPGLSEDVYGSIGLTMVAIAERPGSFPLVRKDVRRALVRRFPYAVYFRRKADHIVVLAILHTARSSQELTRRLRKRR